MADWHLNSHRRQSYEAGQVGAISAAVIGNAAVRSTSERFVGAMVAVGTTGTGASEVTVTKISGAATTVLATIALGIGDFVAVSDINQKDGVSLAQGDILQFEVTTAGATAADTSIMAVTHITRR